MRFPRMAIEQEAPEQLGYDRIRSNLTESSVRDRSLRELSVDLSDLPLAYTDHMGHPGLRELVAASAGAGTTADDVMLAAGASSALFMTAMALLEPGDHAIVVRPNYATNIETPRILRCRVDLLDLEFERGFALDPGRVRALLRPETKLVSVTAPHNPTGVAPTLEILRELAEITATTGARLLVDETYRDLAFAEPLPMAATLGEHVIGVSSLSKAYGIPGIRLGWVMARDPALMQQLLCVKEQIGICGSVIDEAIGYHAYAARLQWLPENRRHLQAQFERVRRWLADEPLLEWVEPGGGCVCFPRIRADAGIDTARFYRCLNDVHGTYVGPGHWFEQPDSYFRIGYGWPTADELELGLAAISKALRAV